MANASAQSTRVYLDTTTNSPLTPTLSPGGGEGEAHVLPTILPRPRRGGEGRGEGAGGGTDRISAQSTRT